MERREGEGEERRFRVNRAVVFLYVVTCDRSSRRTKKRRRKRSRSSPGFFPRLPVFPAGPRA